MTIKLPIIAVLLTVAPSALADERSYTLDSWELTAKPGVAPSKNDAYLQHCSSCHYPYQAGLLPAMSWEHLINQLPAHFSTTLSLQEDALGPVRDYLLDNAAGRVNYEISKKVMTSAMKNGALPLTVTGTPYFIDRHSSIGNEGGDNIPKVTNLTNCVACHQGAADGVFK